MKKFSFIAVSMLLCGSIVAADQSEVGARLTPLKIYSGGVGVGVLRSGSNELKDVAESFLKMSFVNSFHIRQNVSMFLDIDWLLPDNHGGADLGFDYLFAKKDIRPFAGVGIGGHYIDHGGDFGDDFGPSLTAHLGCTLDLNENVAVRMRIPYHFVMNDANDHLAGLDIAFLFSSKFKNVKKLNY